MKYPNFFNEVENIRLYDPLAEFLGAFIDGEMEIEYIDVVKFAGHSCPTVAGAYLMTKEGLKELFKDTLPVRGEIELFVKGKKEEGVNGVIANVVSYICGISDEGGFKGISGRFSRAKRVFFNAQIDGQVRLKRVDSDSFVDIDYNPSIVPSNPKMKELMQKIFTENAKNEDIKIFQKLWQERVKKILFYENIKEIVKVKKY